MYIEPTELAHTAADAVRDLNRATDGHGEGWEDAFEAHTVIGALGEMAGRLPQALQQTARLLRHLDAEDALRSTGNTDKDLRTARDALSDAENAAATLHRALNRAHTATSRLHTR